MTTFTKRMARSGIATGGLALIATLLPVGSSAPAWANDDPHQQLAQVRQATDRFHDLAATHPAGYDPFLPCFDSPEGGMGQHFANQTLLGDGKVDLLNPEILVYEPRPDGYKLVAVEYVVPDPNKEMTAPTLMGQTFGYLPELGVWKLHAWIWRPNPAGMFKDYNAKVRQCP